MFDYNICNQPDLDLFAKQCRALELNIPNLETLDRIEDVDGTVIQAYSHSKGKITVKNDMQVGALYITSDFDLIPYFS